MQILMQYHAILRSNWMFSGTIWQKNRTCQALAEKFAAKENLEEGFLHALRIQAATVFTEAIIKQCIINRKMEILNKLNELMEINHVLYYSGEIAEQDLIQTSIEARNFELELLDEKAQMAEIFSNVYMLIGYIPADSLIFTGNPENILPIKSYAELNACAFQYSDLINVARYAEQAAMHQMMLWRSERILDISLMVGYHNNETKKPMPGMQYAYVGTKDTIVFFWFQQWCPQACYGQIRAKPNFDVIGDFSDGE